MNEKTDLSEAELDALRAEQDAHKSAEHNYETYGAYDQTAADKSSVIDAAEIKSALVRRPQRSRHKYTRQTVIAVGLTGVGIGGIVSFALTQNVLHLIVAAIFLSAMLPVVRGERA